MVPAVESLLQSRYENQFDAGIKSKSPLTCTVEVFRKFDFLHFKNMELLKFNLKMCLLVILDSN